MQPPHVNVMWYLDKIALSVNLPTLYSRRANDSLACGSPHTPHVWFAHFSYTLHQGQVAVERHLEHIFHPHFLRKRSAHMRQFTRVSKPFTSTHGTFVAACSTGRQLGRYTAAH
eukprot:scaffold108605_cov36-Tisochrysis_lutea.AAC.1